ncbi:hypothetical protein R3P38DRAFT_3175560 [Favolaschia claudopus]|uniref:Uncharacterized protein n=1 Tax=Favolaschia claudopus TaxID=2862362 RepID=A0AAW0D172_9AGAR
MHALLTSLVFIDPRSCVVPVRISILIDLWWVDVSTFDLRAFMLLQSPSLIIGRVYAVDSEPRLVLVNTLTPNSRYGRSYPIVEAHMTPLVHAHDLYDTHVRVTHRDQRGSLTTTFFCCYFRCCSNLTLNRSLGVRGEVLIARMARDDIFQLDDFRPTDYTLADHVATVLAPKLRAYQEDGTPVGSFGTVFPGTF